MPENPSEERNEAKKPEETLDEVTQQAEAEILKAGASPAGAGGEGQKPEIVIGREQFFEEEKAGPAAGSQTASGASPSSQKPAEFAETGPRKILDELDRLKSPAVSPEVDAGESVLPDVPVVESISPPTASGELPEQLLSEAMRQLDELIKKIKAE